MTESRLENRATPLTHSESTSGPVVTKTTTTTTTTKLNPSAKSFVFNSAAPAWTPSSPAFKPAAAPVPTTVASPVAAVASPVAAVASPAAAVASPVAAVASPALKPAAAPTAVASPAPKLKAEAKPFVPSFMAKPFVPSFAVAMPTTPVVTPVSTAVSTAKSNDVDAAVETAQPEAPVEPEVDDSTKVSTAPSAANGNVDTASEPTAAVDAVAPLPSDVADVAPAAAALATEPIATTSSVEAEQAAIGARILYSIAQLLELEPERCPMPPSVVGLPVAAETTGKASTAFVSEPASTKSARGNNSRRGGNGDASSRSLNRSASSNNFSDGGGRGNNGRRGGGRSGGGRHNPHDTAPALEDCVPLAINEATRWKPTHAKSKLDVSATTTNDDDASLKEAKALLNKLSIEKFDKLSNELIAVAVRSIGVLTGVIELIILKAKMEWHFATMYAELCTKMANTQMPAVSVNNDTDDDASNVVDTTDTAKLFRRLLLKRCEQEFRDAPSREGFELLSTDDVAEKELILKRGTLGHIRFVGELFKLRLIKARIMHQCIANLFGDTEQPDEESLECLTNLLATIGHAFEANATSDGERAAIAQYYAVIKALATGSSAASSRLSTRIRFMLQDLLDLRKNRWVARRKETKAMTIAEVHAEAKREADEKAKAAGSSGSSSSSARLQRSQSMNAASDRRRATQSNGGSASDAWKARAAGVNVAPASTSSIASSTPSSTANATSTVDADGWETVASGRPKLVKSRSNSDRLPAPVSSGATGSSAATNGRPPKSNTTATASSTPTRNNNKDAARNGRRDRDRSGSASSSSSSIGGSFSALRRGNSLIDLGRPPTSSSSQPSVAKMASSTAVDTASTNSTVSSTSSSTLSAAAFEKHVRAIVDEFVETRDLDEATQCFAELASREHHALIATHSLNLGLEKGDKQRTGVAELLAGLHARNVVTTDEIATPAHELLEFAEDMEIDIPLTLEYVAQMLGPSVASGAMPLDRVVASVQHLAHNGKAARVVAKTLVYVGDDVRAKQLAAVAALDLLPLLAEQERTAEALATFCNDAKVPFLLS